MKKATPPEKIAPDWERMRAEHEAGKSFNQLAREHPASKEGIRKRSMREGWKQDLEPRIRRETDARVAGVVAGSNPEKRNEAVAAEADRRAAVVARHKDEWQQVAALRQEALAMRRPSPDALAKLVPGSIEEVNLRISCVGAAFNAAKLAKITAEMTGLQQTGERRAYKLDDAIGGDGVVRVIVEREGEDDERPESGTQDED